MSDPELPGPSLDQPPTSELTIEPDVRAKVTTAKPVVPHQLREELGGIDIHTAGAPPGDEGDTIVYADVEQADLEAAIAAHVADPLHGQPDHVRTMAALAAKPDWTPDDRDAALRAVMARLLG